MLKQLALLPAQQIPTKKQFPFRNTHTVTYNLVERVIQVPELSLEEIPVIDLIIDRARAEKTFLTSLEQLECSVRFP